MPLCAISSQFSKTPEVIAIAWCLGEVLALAQANPNPRLCAKLGYHSKLFLTMEIYGAKHLFYFSFCFCFLKNVLYQLCSFGAAGCLLPGNEYQ